MKKPPTSLYVAITVFVMATFFVNAQSFLGPTAAYTASTGVGAAVTSYGAPTRIAFGARYNRVLARSSELYAGLSYRIDNGGFTSPFVATAPGIVGGRLNIVEPGPGAPVVTSTINTGAIQLDVGMMFKVADLDTSGSKIMLNVGVLGDRILFADQVDDYSAIPKEDLGTKPTSVSASYGGQFGFGVVMGVGLVMPIGADRIAFDLSYAVRVPTEFTIPNPIVGGPTTQDVGWLVGRGIKIGLTYQFGL
ncbi:MAG: hypothetical protein NTX15_10525 [Candidatus Kapabacteria bacterium]|nr:hypothetical protein [Candidatus Kapabacteria bacterium]